MPVTRKQQHRLDPRLPLVLDTRELGRRPGSMREVRFPAPAPEGLGLELITVPTGSDIDLDLRLESVMEGVLVSGTATVDLVGECGRCLETVSDTLTVDLQELYAYDESEVEEGEAARMEGDHLDLEPLLRDQVVLALPITPLCRQDCPGLCSECGERWETLPEDHAHGTADPRWAGLADLMKNDEEN
ncbi:MAG: YceD family protein [Mycobacteriales bacterium]|nr:YceD family protein [Mycobacteriales bacterium]